MRGEKNTLAAHFWGGNIYPSKIPATKERNSYYSSRKFVYLTCGMIPKRPNDTQRLKILEPFACRRNILALV